MLNLSSDNDDNDGFFFSVVGKEYMGERLGKSGVTEICGASEELFASLNFCGEHRGAIGGSILMFFSLIKVLGIIKGSFLELLLITCKASSKASS